MKLHSYTWSFYVVCFHCLLFLSSSLFFTSLYKMKTSNFIFLQSEISFTLYRMEDFANKKQIKEWWIFYLFSLIFLFFTHNNNWSALKECCTILATILSKYFTNPWMNITFKIFMNFFFLFSKCQIYRLHWCSLTQCFWHLIHSFYCDL